MPPLGQPGPLWDRLSGGPEAVVVDESRRQDLRLTLAGTQAVWSTGGVPPEVSAAIVRSEMVSKRLYGIWLTRPSVIWLSHELSDHRMAVRSLVGKSASSSPTVGLGGIYVAGARRVAILVHGDIHLVASKTAHEVAHHIGRESISLDNYRAINVKNLLFNEAMAELVECLVLPEEDRLVLRAEIKRSLRQIVQETKRNPQALDNVLERAATQVDRGNYSLAAGLMWCIFEKHEDALKEGLKSLQEMNQEEAVLASHALMRLASFNEIDAWSMQDHP
jgi:hypothetical protein